MWPTQQAQTGQEDITANIFPRPHTQSSPELSQETEKARTDCCDKGASDI